MNLYRALGNPPTPHSPLPTSSLILGTFGQYQSPCRQYCELMYCGFRAVHQFPIGTASMKIPLFVDGGPASSEVWRRNPPKKHRNSSTTSPSQLSLEGRKISPEVYGNFRLFFFFFLYETLIVPTLALGSLFLRRSDLYCRCNQILLLFLRHR